MGLAGNSHPCPLLQAAQGLRLQVPRKRFDPLSCPALVESCKRPVKKGASREGPAMVWAKKHQEEEGYARSGR